MSRGNLFVAFVGLLVIAIAVVQWSGPQADAQDTTEDRLSALETEVAVQGTKIANHGREIERLEDQVVTLEAESQPGETAVSGSGDAPTGEGTTVSGVGVMVSDKFSLSSGRYRVTATVEVADFDGFAAKLFGDNGQEELLFNELIETSQTWTGSTIIDVSGGDYAVGVENSSSPWTIVFEKF